MSTVLQSTMSFFGRLPLVRKLALLVAAMAVPAVLLGCFYFIEASAQVRQARQELTGATVLKALNGLHGEIITHRNQAFTLLSGDQARRNDTLAQQTEVEKQIGAVDAVSADLDSFGVSADWSAVKSEWAALRSKVLQGSAEDSETQHAALVAHLDNLAHTVGANSRLIFDSNPQTQPLVRIASDLSPDILLEWGNMRKHAVRAASKGYLGGDDRMGIRTYHDRRFTLTESAAYSVERLSSAAQAAVRPAVDAANTACKDFYSTVETKILNASNMDVTGGAVFDAGVAASRALKNVISVSNEALTKELDARVGQLTWSRDVTAAITAGALFVALLLARLIHRSLAQPLRRAIAAFGRIAAGHYDEAIESRGTDEGAQVLRALTDMQDKLRTQIENERAVAAQNTRVRQALDKASTGVVLANAQHEIIYLNETALTTFSRAQTEIRKSIPGFDSQHLLGAKLEVMSGGDQRSIDSLSGSDVSERKLGALTFRTVTSPVTGEKGERIGTVVEWTNRTEEIGVESEMQTMLAAVVGGDLTSRISMTGKS